jgi:acylphosphatase
VSDVERHRVLYSGDVQGVGFRYTARELARAAGLVGYVRNLTDGRVELVLEGPPSAIRGVMASLEAEMAGHIDETTVEPEPPTGASGFEIRF